MHFSILKKKMFIWKLPRQRPSGPLQHSPINILFYHSYLGFYTSIRNGICLFSFHNILSIWHDTDRVQNIASNNSFVCLSHVAPSFRYLVPGFLGGTTETHTQRDDFIILFSCFFKIRKNKKAKKTATQRCGENTHTDWFNNFGHLKYIPVFYWIITTLYCYQWSSLRLSSVKYCNFFKKRCKNKEKKNRSVSSVEFQFWPSVTLCNSVRRWIHHCLLYAANYETNEERRLIRLKVTLTSP
jgi:hypothetical protein